MQRNSDGKFELKGQSARIPRSIRFDDATWERLGKAAKAYGFSVADLIEFWLNQFPIPTLSHSGELFDTWFNIAVKEAGVNNVWGHPVSLPKLRQALETSMGEVILLIEAESDNLTSLELIPSRLQNWKVCNRATGAITYHFDAFPEKPREPLPPTD